GPALAAVAELLQAPVATSVSGKGCIPDSHPLAVGWGYGRQGTRAAEAAFKDVDLVLAVGVRYSEVSTANYAIPEPGTLIHVDINPQNLGRNVPTHVGLCADARLFLDRLLADGATIRRPPCPQLWQQIQKWRQVDRCEALTARAGLPVKFFVFDDGAYHYMQMLQEPLYRRTTATEIARVDYAAFAQSVGLTFNPIASNADVLPGIQRALATPGPVLTQVLV